MGNIVCTYKVITDAIAADLVGYLWHPITYRTYFENQTKSQLFLHIIYTYLFQFYLIICNALNRNYIHAYILIYIVRLG